MKLAYHGATSMTSDLETDVRVSAKAGFELLEIWADKLDRYLSNQSLGSLKRLFQRNGVTPLAINSIEFIAFRGGEYKRIQERLHVLGRIAQAINCHVIVVVPSPSPNREMGWSSVVSEYVNVLRDLGRIATQYQAKLSLEFLGFGWCSVRTPRAAWEIIKEVNLENIGITIDTAHFFGGGGLLSELDVLDQTRIFSFHLDDMEDLPKEAIQDDRRMLPGMGVIPLWDICHHMKQIGYQGPCTIELFRPEYWSWDPLELAVQCRQAAIKVLSPFFQIE